jgi:hypothetical protein
MGITLNRTSIGNGMNLKFNSDPLDVKLEATLWEIMTGVAALYEPPNVLRLFSPSRIRKRLKSKNQKWRKHGNQLAR